MIVLLLGLSLLKPQFQGLTALEQAYGTHASKGLRVGRGLAVPPMPSLQDYVCDGELVPEERRHSRMLFQPKLHGVNLHGWMIIVPWVTPSLFYQFEGEKQDRVAMDMYNFCRVLGPEEGNRQLREHWRHWLTEDDLVRLASQGINTLRLPVGDWMWEPYEPYAGCTNGSQVELKRVLRLCHRYGLRVLIDLHGTTPRHAPTPVPRHALSGRGVHACTRRRAPLAERLR